jgi:hypothetical protein
MHNKYGPVPVEKEFTLSLLKGEGYLSTVESFTPAGDPTETLVASNEFNLGLFTDQELEVLNLVYSKFEDFTSSQISDFSHDMPGWKNTPIYDTILYSGALDLEKLGI